MHRIIDTNINRVCEGLRVIEDICRFNLESIKLTSSLKILRHQVRDISKGYEESLLDFRDSNGDIGPKSTTTLNLAKNTELKSIVFANFKRVQEGLRSLEEITQNLIFESIRYESYELEKTVILLCNRNKFTLPELYGITYSRDSLNRSNIAVVEEMLKSGIKIIQYREKDLTLKEMLTECLEIKKLTLKFGAIFIVNDYLDIARLVDADGVHIGQDDLPTSMIRKLLGKNKIIGVSTHSSEQALQAVKDGADYIGVGPIHETLTKDNVCAPVGYSYLEWVVKNMKIPFVAIGGIKETNIQDILIRGAKSIALVSDITRSKDIQQKVSKLKEIIKEHNNDI